MFMTVGDRDIACRCELGCRRQRQMPGYSGLATLTEVSKNSATFEENPQSPRGNNTLRTHMNLVGFGGVELLGEFQTSATKL